MKKNQIEKKKHKRHPRRKRRNPAYTGNGLPAGGILAEAALRLISNIFFARPSGPPTGNLFRCTDPKCRAEFGVSGDPSTVKFCIYCRGPVKMYNDGVIDADFTEIEIPPPLLPPSSKIQ
jgi:hypothetical protein